MAVNEGGPSSIVVDGETGRLCDPDAEKLAAAVQQLADSPACRAKLGRQALAAARARTWQASMGQLADGYDRVTERADRPRIKLVQSGVRDRNVSYVTDELAQETTEPSGPAVDGEGRSRPSAPAPPSPDLSDPSLYFNRELSWLDFNDRVLQLAEDPRVPLLERVKFSAIYEDNLDEFFMVRVAGLHEQVEAEHRRARRRRDGGRARSSTRIRAADDRAARAAQALLRG